MMDDDDDHKGNEQPLLLLLLSLFIRLYPKCALFPATWLCVDSIRSGLSPFRGYYVPTERSSGRCLVLARAVCHSLTCERCYSPLSLSLLCSFVSALPAWRA